ncbi:MAG: hypothetical protein ACUZ8E_12500 [Candidatus Anammoxibacter sp.]
MVNEKTSEYAVSVAEFEDTDLLDVSKDIGGGDFQSQKMTAAILRAFYRSASVNLTGSSQTVAFTSPFPNTNFEVFIIDPSGNGWEKLENFTVNGFDITGLSTQTIGYIAIRNN